MAKNITETAAMIAITKKYCAIPSTAHMVVVDTTKSQIKMHIAITFFVVTALEYHEGNRRSRYWFNAIPKTDRKDNNMQITEDDRLSN